MLGETLSLFVEATGKDEALMRLGAHEQEASGAASDSRILENVCVEEKQCLQLKKEEPWEFFRLPSFKLQRKEDFEEEFGAGGDD